MRVRTKTKLDLNQMLEVALSRHLCCAWWISAPVGIGMTSSKSSLKLLMSWSSSIDFDGLGWYRFTGLAGDKLLDKPSKTKQLCQAGGGWINGSHPEKPAEVVKKSVCFTNECYSDWKTDIKVINCGSFFTYHLPNTPSCNLAYCAQNSGTLFVFLV